MHFALLLAAALTVAAGCGEDSIPASTDLAQPLIDLSPTGLHCGGVTCSGGSCIACVEVLGGLCAPPCNTTAPNCTGGATCRSANGVDGGTSNVTFAGDCSAYDGVCL
jgi:hypothetical protein